MQTRVRVKFLFTRTLDPGVHPTESPRLPAGIRQPDRDVYIKQNMTGNYKSMFLIGSTHPGSGRP